MLDGVLMTAEIANDFINDDFHRASPPLILTKNLLAETSWKCISFWLCRERCGDRCDRLTCEKDAEYSVEDCRDQSDVGNPRYRNYWNELRKREDEENESDYVQPYRFRGEYAFYCHSFFNLSIKPTWQVECAHDIRDQRTEEVHERASQVKRIFCLIPIWFVYQPCQSQVCRTPLETSRHSLLKFRQNIRSAWRLNWPETFPNFADIVARPTRPVPKCLHRTWPWKCISASV